jgi:hypothetical protein
MDYMIGEPTVGTLVIASAGAGNQVEQVIAQRDASDKGVVFFWTASRGDKTTLPEIESVQYPDFLLAGETRARAQVYDRLSCVAR